MPAYRYIDTVDISNYSNLSVLYMYVKGRVSLADCIEHLLRLNTHAGVEKSFALAITLSTFCRVGKASWVVYDLGHWDVIDEVLYLKWNDITAKTQQSLNFHHDYSDYRLDVYFFMFLYFLVGVGQNYTLADSYIEEKQKRNLGDSTLIFPFLVPGAAEKVSGYLHECVGKVKILRPGHMNVTAHGLRYGGLQETAVRGQEDAGVYHGGWNKKSNNARFYVKRCYRL